MACGCFPDVRGKLDEALFDPDGLKDAIATLGGGEFATIEILDPPPALPFKADIEAAIAAGRLTRRDDPEPGGIAIYLDETRDVIHFGLVGDGNLVTSRWAGGLVCRHGLFDLPRSHGEMAWFYAPAG